MYKKILILTILLKVKQTLILSSHGIRSQGRGLQRHAHPSETTTWFGAGGDVAASSRQFEADKVQQRKRRGYPFEPGC